MDTYHAAFWSDPCYTSSDEEENLSLHVGGIYDIVSNFTLQKAFNLLNTLIKLTLKLTAKIFYVKKCYHSANVGLVVPGTKGWSEMATH